MSLRVQAIIGEGSSAWLYFPDIDKIELAQETEIEGFNGDISSETRYWLDIYCSDGRYLLCSSMTG
jgi:hypothetical protein